MENQVKYAGFWIRFVAFMVDSLVLVPANLIIGFVAGLIIGIILVSTGQKAANHEQLSFVVGLTVDIVVPWVYFSLMTYYNGATLGKMLVGITVKSEDMGKLGFGKVLIRETIGKLVSGILLCAGYIAAAFTQKKQGLHDMFAKSVVVYKDLSKPHTAGLVVGIIIACVLPLIALFGMLSSIVLVSLNVAREKSKESEVRSVLSMVRAGAEVYYANNKNSYSVAHDCSSGMFADPSMAQIFERLKDKSAVTCYAEGQTYAVSVYVTRSGLNESASNYCIDSSGYNKPGVATDDELKASCKIIAPNLIDSNIK